MKLLVVHRQSRSNSAPLGGYTQLTCQTHVRRFPWIYVIFTGPTGFPLVRFARPGKKHPLDMAAKDDGFTSDIYFPPVRC